jgi:hypothetical protein
VVRGRSLGLGSHLAPLRFLTGVFSRTLSYLSTLSFLAQVLREPKPLGQPQAPLFSSAGSPTNPHQKRPLWLVGDAIHSSLPDSGQWHYI